MDEENGYFSRLPKNFVFFCELYSPMILLYFLFCVKYYGYILRIIYTL